MHTIKSKLHTQKNASIKYGIPPTTIADWMKKEQAFLNLPSNMLNKKTLNKGKDILYPDVEAQLVNFIEFNRKFFNPVGTWSLLLKLYTLITERKKLSIKTSQTYIYRFLRRNGFSFRTKTNIGKTFLKIAFFKLHYF